VALVTRLDLAAGEPIHVLVPSRTIGEGIEALSPRFRTHRGEPADGPVTGDAARSQVWVPRNGSPGIPDNGFLESLPSLRLVQLLSAGAEKFLGRLPEGVVLCNARGAHTPSTAEWAVTATLAAQRGIPFFVREQDARRWSFTTHATLVGARVLVIGAGDIGQAIGRMLAGFDVQLTYVARKPREGVRSTADLPELLPQADVVILIVPVTPETRGMVDAGFLAAMKDGALLVNAARGVVVDTEALLAELTTGRLRAAVDVTDPEPLPEDHPLWSAPGVLITPHVGGAVPETRARAAATAVDQMARVLAGEPLLNVVGDY
jgi:phosphoglycerate dehydrogenase-like enzyme